MEYLPRKLEDIGSVDNIFIDINTARSKFYAVYKWEGLQGEELIS